MNFIKRLFGDGKAEATPPPAPAPPPEPEPKPMEINEITPEALKDRLDNGDELLVVDMRQTWEYDAGHIPGARHMFIQEIPARYEELPQDVEIVFQCWSGNTSLDASAFLIQNGWSADRVSSLSGGIGGWVQTHGPESLVKD